MKKRMIFVLSLGLMFSCTMMGMEKGMGSISNVQAVEGTDQDALIEEISPDDLYSAVQDEPDSAKVLDGLEFIPESEDADAENRVPDIDLYINDKVVSVTKEKIALIRESEVVFPQIYQGMYVAYFESGSKKKYSLYLSLMVDSADLHIYDYDAENTAAKKQMDDDRISMDQDGSLSILMEQDSACVIVLERAEIYPEIGFGVSPAEEALDGGSDLDDQDELVIDQIEEIVLESSGASGSEAGSEPETESESEPVTEFESDTGLESETELNLESETELESESGSDTGLESETELNLESEPETESEFELDTEVESESELESASEQMSESEIETEVASDEFMSEMDTEFLEETLTESESDGAVESENDSEAADESETESESESVFFDETESDSEIQTESEAETETEIQTEVQTESETETESLVRLVDIELRFVEGSESIPVLMLPYVTTQDILRVELYYSDGSEQLLTEDTDSMGNTCVIAYEDTVVDDGSVSRVYTAKVIPAETETLENEKPVEKSGTIIFRSGSGTEIEEIEANGKTSVRIPGKKNWVLVQSVPEVTGTYSMQSFGRSVKDMYYFADGDTQALKAEDVFQLNRDILYTFFLRLE